jgi:hypothetical protein
MHRKLMHSIRALAIALGLLTAGLIASVPVPAPTGDIAGQAPTILPAGAKTEATQSPAKAYKRNRRAQARDALALPFFSFAQGLRSGNGS